MNTGCPRIRGREPSGETGIDDAPGSTELGTSEAPGEAVAPKIVRTKEVRRTVAARASRFLRLLNGGRLVLNRTKSRSGRSLDQVPCSVPGGDVGVGLSPVTMSAAPLTKWAMAWRLVTVKVTRSFRLTLGPS